MAEFDFDPKIISDLIESMKKADLFDEENQSRLLDMGADVVIDNIKAEMRQSGFNITKFEDKIKKTKVKKDKSGNLYVTITPRGNYTGNGKTRRVATILFVLNYGRRKKYGEIQGGYFWTNGAKKGEKEAYEAMTNEVEKIYRERGLI